MRNVLLLFQPCEERSRGHLSDREAPEHVWVVGQRPRWIGRKIARQKDIEGQEGQKAIWNDHEVRPCPEPGTCWREHKLVQSPRRNDELPAVTIPYRSQEVVIHLPDVLRSPQGNDIHSLLRDEPDVGLF